MAIKKNDAIVSIKEQLQAAETAVNTGDVWGARWAVERAVNLLEDSETLLALGYVLEYTDGFSRRLREATLDDYPYPYLGKFEGEPASTQVLHSLVVEGLTKGDTFIEGDGWYYLIEPGETKFSEDDPKLWYEDRAFGHPAYIVRESDETGLVTAKAFDSVKEASAEFDRIVESGVEDVK